MLLEKLRCETVLITLGENGMSLFQKGRPMVRIHTVAQDVFDVSGAGDTVIGAYTLARARKATPLEAAHISNCAAGVVVGKVGVAATTPEELLERIRLVLHAQEPPPSRRAQAQAAALNGTHPVAVHRHDPFA